VLAAALDCYLDSHLEDGEPPAVAQLELVAALARAVADVEGLRDLLATVHAPFRPTRREVRMLADAAAALDLALLGVRVRLASLTPPASLALLAPILQEVRE